MYNRAYLHRNGSGSAAAVGLESTVWQADTRRHAATVRSGHAVGRRAHTELVEDWGSQDRRGSALISRCQTPEEAAILTTCTSVRRRTVDRVVGVSGPPPDPISPLVRARLGLCC